MNNKPPTRTPPAPPPMRRGDGGYEELYAQTVQDLDKVCFKQTMWVWIGLIGFLVIEVPVLHYYLG